MSPYSLQLAGLLDSRGWAYFPPFWKADGPAEAVASALVNIDDAIVECRRERLVSVLPSGDGGFYVIDAPRFN